MQMTWQKRRAPSCSRMERKTLMSRGKRFARRRERYETAEAALGPEAPGAKAFAVSGNNVAASIVAAFPRLAIALRAWDGKNRLPIIAYWDCHAHRLSACVPREKILSEDRKSTRLNSSH